MLSVGFHVNFDVKVKILLSASKMLTMKAPLWEPLWNVVLVPGKTLRFYFAPPIWRSPPDQTLDLPLEHLEEWGVRNVGGGM